MLKKKAFQQVTFVQNINIASERINKCNLKNLKAKRKMESSNIYLLKCWVCKKELHVVELQRLLTILNIPNLYKRPCLNYSKR